MTGGRIGVGIIGVSVERGWGGLAHVPAIARSPAFELVALSTSCKRTAQAAGEKYGVALAFDNHADLVAWPEVDLVVVTVKVPHHLELVTAAIGAGKAVYCEWPLGRNVAEAERMEAMAQSRGVRAFVGLQGRSAPPLRYLRDLVREGYVGKVLSTTMIGSGAQWGATIDLANAYTNDASTGATMLTIPMGHGIDALCWTLGEFDRITASAAVRRTRVGIEGTSESVTRTAADQIAVSGVLASGAVASVHYRGGLSRGTNLLWEINGSEGDLRLTADNGHLQIVPVTIEGTRGDAPLTPLVVPDDYVPVGDAESGRPYNLTQVYARLPGALAGNEEELPTFTDAVCRHRLLARIEQAAGFERAL